jgi:uncharacterized protein with NRDE domain
MSAVPELRKKKIARDAELQKKAAADTAEAAKKAKALTEEITNKAKAYEAEYEKVRLIMGERMEMWYYYDRAMSSRLEF